MSHQSGCTPASFRHLPSASSLSHLFLISFSSLSSLSPLSLSPLCLSSFRLSSLSSLAGGSGQRATYKGLFTPASKKSAVFFPTSLPSTFPFWSASFRPPPWPQVQDTEKPLRAVLFSKAPDGIKRIRDVCEDGLWSGDYGVSVSYNPHAPCPKITLTQSTH